MSEGNTNFIPASSFRDAFPSLTGLRRTDCAEFSDCFVSEVRGSCDPDCISYNKISNETVDDLNPCTCKADKDNLEIAHVTYGCWAVICYACKALGKHGSSKTAAVQFWNQGKLAREGVS